MLLGKLEMESQFCVLHVCVCQLDLEGKAACWLVKAGLAGEWWAQASRWHPRCGSWANCLSSLPKGQSCVADTLSLHGTMCEFNLKMVVFREQLVFISSSELVLCLALLMPDSAVRTPRKMGWLLLLDIKLHCLQGRKMTSIVCFYMVWGCTFFLNDCDTNLFQ